MGKFQLIWNLILHGNNNDCWFIWLERARIECFCDTFVKLHLLFFSLEKNIWLNFTLHEAIKIYKTLNIEKL